MIPNSDPLVADLLKQIIEIALLLDFAHLLQQLLVQTNLLSRHLLASSAAIRTLLLDRSVLLGRFVHELVSVLAALLDFLLLARLPLLVLRNRVLHLLAIKICLILDLLLSLLLLGHSLFI